MFSSLVSVLAWLKLAEPVTTDRDEARGVDEHVLGVDEAHVDLIRELRTFLEPAVEAVQCHVIADGHDDVRPAAQPVDLPPALRQPGAVTFLLHQGEAQHPVVTLVDLGEILVHAEGKGHEQRLRAPRAISAYQSSTAIPRRGENTTVWSSTHGSGGAALSVPVQSLSSGVVGSSSSACQ